MASSSKSNNCHHIRSISLPSRSHPSTFRIEEELNKLKTYEATSSSVTAETICIGLSGLQELYGCMNDLFSLPLTQQALSCHQHEKWVHELLDGSILLLDICGSTRDLMLQIKEQAKDLQSALRRRKGDVSVESSIAKYTSFRIKLKKDAKRSTAALKQLDNKMVSSQILDLDHHLTAVIRVLREVGAMSNSIFHSILLFLSVPALKPKPNRWSLVSKLMHKGAVACKDLSHNVNELESVDAALCGLRTEGEKSQIAQNRLKAMESSVQCIENDLDCMFRHLLKTRASLLNIISI